MHFLQAVSLGSNTQFQQHLSRKLPLLCRRGAISRACPMRLGSLPVNRFALVTITAGLIATSSATAQAVPQVGMGGLVPNARALASYITATYPGVQSIGGVRADSRPDHPSGRALDIMIGSNMGLGDAINADIKSQSGRFGVQYTMWRVADHYNHVHVTVS